MRAAMIAVDRRMVASVGIVVGAYGLLLALLAPASFPGSIQGDSRIPFLADKPVGEDGFYMLSVAWNLAEGRGLVSSSGEVTTGVQPLATFLYAGLARVVIACSGDKWTLVRATILSGLAAWLVLAWLLGRIGARLVSRSAGENSGAQVAGIASILALTSFHLFRLATYGLETGIYLAGFAATVLWILRRDGRVVSSAESVRLGFLVGVTTLARIDFALLAAAAALPLFLSRKPWRGPLVVTAGIALAIVAPWFAWVRSVAGTWIPTSGSAQMSYDMSWARVWALVLALMQEISPWVYNGGRTLPFVAGLATLAFALLLARRRRAGHALLERPSAATRSFRHLAIAASALVPIYFFNFGAGHFYARYLAPLLVFSVPWLAIELAPWVVLRPRRRALLAGVLLSGFAAQAYLSLHTGRIGNSHALAAGYLSTLPPGLKVGAFQSGVLGYFRDGVYNLDGKVSRAALDAAKRGALPDYIEASGIDVLIGWPEEIEYLRRLSPQLARWGSCDARPPVTHDCIRRPR